MTYVLYAAWILALVLTVGELDHLIARRLMQRFRLTLPEGHWLTAGFLSAMLPGLGQFLNGEPLKALFLIVWPFATLYGWPVPRPWQLLALKTGWILLPWWAVAVGDALVVGFLNQRWREREQQASRQEQASNTIDYYSYLSERQKRHNSGN